ncbi:MAG: hypothetical protein H0V66_10035 [Bdellovibrionales bacterium]|nr:hypothetical protein [Bdellovibrionales bacterium]
MKRLILLNLLILLLSACAKPKATVFLDKSLQEEEMVKFCFTGDMGKDTPHQQSIAQALKFEGCHRIFFLGDLVYPKGIDSLDSEEFTKKFLAYYEPLLQENPNLYINLILGNHDHKGKPEVWKKISEINDRFFFPGYHYMIDYGGLCIAAMDTSLYYYLNDVTEVTQQTRWIQGLQSRLKDCDVKIAVTHHPFKGQGLDPEDDWDGSTGSLKVFLDTYVIGVFDLHIAGHVHVLADDGKDEGTRMLISGAGGEVRGDNKPGYLVLNWQPGNPKRIGYNLKYIDTTLNVVDDSESVQMQEEDVGPESVIAKRFVENNWFRSLWLKIKSFF